MRGGLFGSVRATAMIEEHGAGKQLFRLRALPCIPALTIVLVVLLAATALLAANDRAYLVALPLGAFAAVIAYLSISETTAAMQRWVAAVESYNSGRN